MNWHDTYYSVNDGKVLLITNPHLNLDLDNDLHLHSTTIGSPISFQVLSLSLHTTTLCSPTSFDLFLFDLQNIFLPLKDPCT